MKWQICFALVRKMQQNKIAERGKRVLMAPSFLHNRIMEEHIDYAF